MNTPITDKLVEKLNVEPWLSTETKCRSLHDHAEKLEEIATDALKSFRCTQRPSDYPEDHWSRRLENLMENALGQ